MTALAHRLRDWWQQRSENQSLSLDADSGAFATSLLIHFGLLLALGLVGLLGELNADLQAPEGEPRDEEEREDGDASGQLSSSTQRGGGERGP